VTCDACPTSRSQRVRPLPGDHGATAKKLEPGILHRGLGALFLAHGAKFTEDALATESGPWGITGVSLQRPDQRDRLLPQDGLYTLDGRGAGTPTVRVIGCVRDVLVASEDPQRILARLADPATSIVSLTITEKGCGHDPASGRLQACYPMISRARCSVCRASPPAAKRACRFRSALTTAMNCATTSPRNHFLAIPRSAASKDVPKSVASWPRSWPSIRHALNTQDVVKTEVPFAPTLGPRAIEGSDAAHALGSGASFLPEKTLSSLAEKAQASTGLTTLSPASGRA
jgi:hypothetical protein